MAPKPKYTDEQAAAIKEMIYGGAPNEQVASAFGISVNTVVNIKAGRQYTNALWPTGTSGPMPALQAQANANNKRFTTISEDSQWIPEPERLYRRSSIPVQKNLDDLAKDRTCSVCGKDDFEGWIEFNWHRIKHEDDAKEAERQKRREEGRRRQEEFDRKWPNGKPYDGPPRPDPNGPFEPPADAMKPWDDILFIAGEKVAIVAKAENEDNQNLKDAISHIFFELTTGQWNEPNIAAACLKLEQRIKMARSTEIIQIE